MGWKLVLTEKNQLHTGDKMKNTGCKYLPVILLLFLIFNIDVTAQTAGKLAGKVTDETGQPLIGATVLVEGTNKGAVTDIDGYYTVLNLRAGTYTVEFRYTGYQTKKVSEVVISTEW